MASVTDLISIIRRGSLAGLRDEIYPVAGVTAVELLKTALLSSNTQYVISSMTAEILWWCLDDQTFVESNRSKYPMALKEAIEEAGDDISASLITKLKAVGQKVRRLKELTATATNPSKKDSTGNSAMHYASDLGLNNMVKGMLKIGGDINLLNRQEDTPCHIAARTGRKTLLEDILLTQSMKDVVNWTIQGDKLDQLIKNEWGDSNWVALMFYKLRKPLREGFMWVEDTRYPCPVNEAVQAYNANGNIGWYSKNSVCTCEVCKKYFFAVSVAYALACPHCENSSIEVIDQITGLKIPISEAKKEMELITKRGTEIESKVQPYHTRPRFNFFKTPSEADAKRFYGFELELVVEDFNVLVRSSMKIAYRAGNEFFMNSDSSIREHREDGKRYASGYELISHPMTLNYVRESKKLTEVFNVLQDEGARSVQNTTTGLHIHVSRAGFETVGCMRRVHEFFYSPANDSFIDEIAGRRRTSYQMSNQTTPPRGFMGGDRYEIINYNNTYTVEFRLFKGGVGKDWLVEKVEFLDCLIEFCKNADSVTVEEFEKFTLLQGEDKHNKRGKKVGFDYKYPTLVAFLKNRKAKHKAIPFLYVA